MGWDGIGWDGIGWDGIGWDMACDMGCGMWYVVCSMWYVGYGIWDMGYGAWGVVGRGFDGVGCVWGSNKAFLPA